MSKKQFSQAQKDNQIIKRSSLFGQSQLHSKRVSVRSRNTSFIDQRMSKQPQPSQKPKQAENGSENNLQSKFSQSINHIQVKMAAKKSSMRKRLSRKSGIRKLSQELYSSSVIKSIKNYMQQSQGQSVILSKRFLHSNIEQEQKRRSKNNKERQSNLLYEADKKRKKSAQNMKKTKSNISSQRSETNASRIINQSFNNVKINPEGINQTIYPEIFPLGNKSYGTLYENYYCLIIDNNEVYHISRDALPGSFVIFANIQVRDNLIHMQCVSIFTTVSKQLVQKEVDRTYFKSFKRDASRNQQNQKQKNNKYRPSLSLPISSKLKIQKYNSDSVSNYYLQSRSTINEKVYQQKQQNKLKTYLHINLTQFNLRTRTAVSKQNFCYEYMNQNLTKNNNDKKPQFYQQNKKSRKNIKFNQNLVKSDASLSPSTAMNRDFDYVRTTKNVSVGDFSECSYDSFKKIKRISMVTIKKEVQQSSKQDKSDNQSAQRTLYDREFDVKDPSILYKKSNKNGTQGKRNLRSRTGKTISNCDFMQIQQGQQNSSQQRINPNNQLGEEQQSDSQNQIKHSISEYKIKNKNIIEDLNHNRIMIKNKKKPKKMQKNKNYLYHNMDVKDNENSSESRKIEQGNQRYDANNVKDSFGSGVASANDKSLMSIKIKKQGNNLKNYEVYNYSSQEQKRSSSQSQSYNSSKISFAERQSKSSDRNQDRHSNRKLQGKSTKNIRKTALAKQKQLNYSLQRKKNKIKCNVQSIIIMLEVKNNVQNRIPTNQQDLSTGSNKGNSIKILYFNVKDFLVHKESSSQKQKENEITDKEKAPQYEIVEFQVYNQHLRKCESTIRKNWSKIEENKIFLITNLAIYQICVKNMRKRAEFQEFIESQHITNIKTQKSLKKLISKREIKCRNQKILEKIIEYDSNQLQHNRNWNRKRIRSNTQTSNTQSVIVTDQKSQNMKKKPSLKKVDFANSEHINKYFHQVLVEIVDCCWLNQEHIFILGSNSMMYQIQEGIVTACKDLLNLIQQSEEHQSNNFKNQFAQKQQLHYSGQLIRILQIQCIKGTQKQSCMIVARVQVICDVIQKVSYEQSTSNHNIVSGTSQNQLPSKRIIYQLQNQVYVFKHNKRWTQFYSKMENFINEQIMRSRANIEILAGRPSFSTKFNKISNISTVFETMDRFNLHQQSIQLKVLDFRNYISSQYLRNLNDGDMQAERGVNREQFFVYCQWGMNLDLAKKKYNQSNDKDSFSEIKKNKINSKNVSKSRKSISSMISNKSGQKNKSCSSKSIRFSQQEKVSGSFPNEMFDDDGIGNNLELFIVDINIFGKYIRNPEDLNPMCIRLQDYYNANLKNVFQIKFRNPKQRMKLENGNFSNSHHERNLSPYYSFSANAFNVAVLSKIDDRRKLTIYQKNVLGKMKPQHFLHVGLSTKTFIQSFRHNFEISSSPNCICIDNFALHLISASNEKIQLYYILKDRLLYGSSLALNNIMFMKYDRYNWHLYAHNSNVLFIINPWKFQIQRQLAFEGEILTIEIGNDFVFVKWKERINQAVFLTVFPLYEAISDDFKTFQTQLDIYVAKEELNKYLNLCEVYNIRKKTFRDSRRQSQISRHAKILQQKVFQDYQESQNYQYIELKYCFDAFAENNILFILNQYYLQVHSMKFTSVFDKIQTANDEQYYQEYFNDVNNWIQLNKQMQSNKNNLKSGKDLKRKSRFSQGSLSYNSHQKISRGSLNSNSNKLQAKGRTVSISRRPSIFANEIQQALLGKKFNGQNQTINQASEQSYSSKYSKENSNSRSRSKLVSSKSRLAKSSKTVSQNSFNSSESSQQQVEQDNAKRIRISFENSNKRQVETLLFHNRQEQPTCMKYQSNSSTLIIGTNLGKIMAIHYDHQCLKNNFLDVAYPFFCQKVSHSKIESLTLSKGVASICVYAYTHNQSIIGFRVNFTKDEKLEQQKRKQFQNINQSQSESQQAKSQKTLFKKLAYYQALNSCPKKLKQIKQTQNQLIPRQKQSEDALKDISRGELKQLLFKFLGQHETHSLLSNKYRLYTPHHFHRLAQQIQQLELMLLKIQGDREQMMIKNKAIYEQEVTEMEKVVHRFKVTNKAQFNKLKITQKNTLTHLQQLYDSEKQHTDSIEVSNINQSYQKTIKALYCQNKQLKDFYQSKQRQNTTQLHNLRHHNETEYTTALQSYSKILSHKATLAQNLIKQIDYNIKANQIQNQETDYQYKILKEKQIQKMDDYLQKQIKISEDNKYMQWNNIGTIGDVKNKINQFQQLIIQFQMEMQIWKENMGLKMEFYQECEESYRAVQKEVEIKQEQHNTICRKIQGQFDNKKYSKCIYQLNQIIKCQKIQIQFKEAQQKQMKQRLNKIQSEIQKCSTNLQQKLNQKYRNYNLIHQRSSDLSKTKSQLKQINGKSLIQKNKVNLILYQINKFSQECLNDYFREAKIKQMRNKSDHPQLFSISLKLHPKQYSKSEIKHLQFFNQNVANLHIQMPDESSSKSQTKQFNKDSINQETENNKKQLLEFMEFIDKVKEKQDLEKIGKNFIRREQTFLNSFQNFQVYNQNKQLISDVNKLREEAYTSQQKIERIKRQISQIKSSVSFNDISFQCKQKIKEIKRTQNKRMTTTHNDGSIKFKFDSLKNFPKIKAVTLYKKQQIKDKKIIKQIDNQKQSLPKIRCQSEKSYKYFENQKIKSILCQPQKDNKIENARSLIIKQKTQQFSIQNLRNRFRIFSVANNSKQKLSKQLNSNEKSLKIKAESRFDSGYQKSLAKDHGWQKTMNKKQYKPINYQTLGRLAIRQKVNPINEQNTILCQKKKQGECILARIQQFISKLQEKYQQIANDDENSAVEECLQGMNTKNTKIKTVEQEQQRKKCERQQMTAERTKKRRIIEYCHKKNQIQKNSLQRLKL